MAGSDVGRCAVLSSHKQMQRCEASQWNTEIHSTHVMTNRPRKPGSCCGGGPPSTLNAMNVHERNRRLPPMQRVTRCGKASQALLQPAQPSAEPASKETEDALAAVCGVLFDCLPAVLWQALRRARPLAEALQPAVLGGDHGGVCGVRRAKLAQQRGAIVAHRALWRPHLHIDRARWLVSRRSDQSQSQLMSRAAPRGAAPFAAHPRQIVGMVVICPSSCHLKAAVAARLSSCNQTL